MKHVTLKKEKKRKEFIRIHSLTFGYDFIPIHLHSIIVEESSKTWQRIRETPVRSWLPES